MDGYKIFTLKPGWFPLEKVREFVSYLHDRDQHYVMMVDPGERILSSVSFSADESSSGGISSMNLFSFNCSFS